MSPRRVRTPSKGRYPCPASAHARPLVPLHFDLVRFRELNLRLAPDLELAQCPVRIGGAEIVSFVPLVGLTGTLFSMPVVVVGAVQVPLAAGLRDCSRRPACGL